MPQLPWDLLWVDLKTLIAPALGASFALMLALRYLGGERLTPLAAGLAVAAGVVVGNHFSAKMEWQLDSERPLTWSDFRKVLGWSLESKTAVDAGDAEDLPPIPKPRYWLPWVAGLAMAVELLVGFPGAPASVGWVARTLVALFAARLLTPLAWRVEMPWMLWLLGAAIALEWLVLATLARQWKDSTIVAGLALWLAAACVVIVLQAHSALYMQIALLFFAAILGPALVAWKWPGDTGTAVAGVVAMLPGLLLLSYHGAPSEDDQLLPMRNFLLVGLAPLALTPMLLPFFARQPRWKHWLPAFALLLIPLALAVTEILQTESLDFSDL